MHCRKLLERVWPHMVAAPAFGADRSLGWISGALSRFAIPFGLKWRETGPEPTSNNFVAVLNEAPAFKNFPGLAKMAIGGFGL